MRVGVVIPPNREGHVRGGHVQMVKTIDALKELMVDICVVQSVGELGGNVDLCHVVGIQDSEFALEQSKLAKRLGIRLVVSPIWWDFHTLMLHENWLSTLENMRPRWVKLSRINPLLAQMCFIFVHRIKIHFANRRRAAACRLADLTLPNSPGEALQVDALVGKALPYVVVRNGVDENLFRVTNMHDVRDIPVLFVGIVDRTKNVHRLIQATNDLELPLKIVGQSPDPAYQTFCESLDSKGLVTWTGKLSHTDLVIQYNRARVVILNSMRETPGLTLLEGAACGANVVATRIGSANEYFGEFAEYCDPKSVDSIREALRRALRKSCPNIELSSYVRKRFTWTLAAVDTLVGYESAMNDSPSRVTSLTIGAFEHATSVR